MQRPTRGAKAGDGPAADTRDVGAARLLSFADERPGGKAAASLSEGLPAHLWSLSTDQFNPPQQKRS